MKYNKGCLVCGKELIYTQEFKEVECIECKTKHLTNVTCEDGHYVCDSCHNIDANDYIEKFCLETKEKNPLIIAEELMKNHRIKLHGPEHHFLVPASLITSYYNHLQDNKSKKIKLSIARKRAQDIKGGMCGYFGACGAAIGAGIFISIVSEATPLTTASWGFANKVTGSILVKMGEMGGPRCCKRNTLTSIVMATELLYEEQRIKLFEFEDSKKHCKYKSLNNQCIKQKCPYF